MGWGKPRKGSFAAEMGDGEKGKKAAKAARTSLHGMLGPDGKVRDTKGKVTGDFSGRKLRNDLID